MYGVGRLSELRLFTTEQHLLDFLTEFQEERNNGNPLYYFKTLKEQLLIGNISLTIRETEVDLAPGEKSKIKILSQKKVWNRDQKHYTNKTYV